MNKEVNNATVEFVLYTVNGTADGAIASVRTEGVIMENAKRGTTMTIS
jgi:hypothetical protein